MERRFGIIIGINDYDKNPLSFCVDDATAMKTMLVDKAGFRNDDVHLIVSDTSTPIKNISGKMSEIIESIRGKFSESTDSIFFYFAGHGFSESGTSKVLLHDSSLSIIDIFQIILPLRPKMQFYIIDACESGGKTLTRGQSGRESIDEYIAASSGALFLYACQEDENAFEIDGIKHGLMTHFFLEATTKVNLYDEEGILTPGRIHEYVAKKVASHSKFAQVPVMESRVVGFYPFIGKASVEAAPQPAPEGDQSERGVSKIAYDRESRLYLQEIAFARTTAIVNELAQKYSSSFSVVRYENIHKMDLANKKFLKERIVGDASSKYESIRGVISERREPVYDGLMNPMLAALGKLEPSSYKKVLEIDVDHEFYNSIDLGFFSSDKFCVSFGIGVVLYQAKWGGVISPYVYEIEWDGDQDGTIDRIEKSNYTYLISDESEGILQSMEFDEFKNIEKTLTEWNDKRKKEIELFLNSKK